MQAQVWSNQRGQRGDQPWVPGHLVEHRVVLGRILDAAHARIVRRVARLKVNYIGMLGETPGALNQSIEGIAHFADFFRRENILDDDETVLFIFRDFGGR